MVQERSLQGCSFLEIPRGERVWPEFCAFHTLLLDLLHLPVCLKNKTKEKTSFGKQAFQKNVLSLCLPLGASTGSRALL